MNEWQPIETAPKDGRDLMLWWPYWSARPTVGFWKHSMWIAEASLSDVGEGSPGPTHWMPLPEPPK